MLNECILQERKGGPMILDAKTKEAAKLSNSCLGHHRLVVRPIEIDHSRMFQEMILFFRPSE
jgi:hypothetical protein